MHIDGKKQHFTNMITLFLFGNIER